MEDAEGAGEHPQAAGWVAGCSGQGCTLLPSPYFTDWSGGTVRRRRCPCPPQVPGTPVLCLGSLRVGDSGCTVLCCDPALRRFTGRLSPAPGPRAQLLPTATKPQLEHGDPVTAFLGIATLWFPLPRLFWAPDLCQAWAGSCPVPCWLWGQPGTPVSGEEWGGRGQGGLGM